MSNVVKVAITGAAGQIGYALCFRIASGQMFGPSTPVQLNLLELPQAQEALKGVKMELDDCAFPLLDKVVCTSNLDEAFSDVDWALLVGAVPRKEGMERGDLLKVNGSIFGPQGKSLSDNAKKSAKVLVVGNPCNTNAYILKQNAPNLDPANIFAMTALDENRAKSQLAQKAGVSVKEIQNMVIWGNHSATQYPDFYNATIQGKKAHEVITDESWAQGDFISTVQKRGAAIIKARGASSAASAANAVVDSVVKVENKSGSKEVFSLCIVSKGDYGVDEGLVYSFPCVSENGVIKVVPGFEHNTFAKEKLQVTLEELRSERDTTKGL